ncbi:unnamed protein product [Knipowitschia caucasica]|uniref:LIM and calponin homology domains-containing protein 1-like n=1 Tax=Knipowitschia caucasica TaxID=637954 RepID=A0AAV2LIA5_KNICA
MASQENGIPREEQGASEHGRPEPACQEAQKWIEAVTGKSFGDRDFRSALENGILLCELLSAIKPGAVKKINRLPTPIAGLDNLTVFLRGCEELGLKGAQLFDPGDLQDTSIRANLKDSDCTRKLKNVLNTVFWLGKAASACTPYTGPTLNHKEFEELLAHMKLESEESGDSSQKRSVRDSGYDCWDSERSDSLSPPRHTRDNSLDSLDSFGSRSQHTPSPDVVNRGNSDGRGSDPEADGRRADVRKDDMLARRTAASDTRSSVPFNQFLPNRANSSAYVPGPRRKQPTEEGEQRSKTNLEHGEKPRLHFRSPKCVTWAPDNGYSQKEQPILEDDEAESREAVEQRKMERLEKAGVKVLPAAAPLCSPGPREEPEVRGSSPTIILRRDNDFLRSQKAAWDCSSDGEEVEVQKIPDVRKDDLASRRAAHRAAPRRQQFVPSACSDKDLQRWEGIRRASQHSLQEREASDRDVIPDIITRRENPFLKSSPRNEQEEGEVGADEEGEEEEGKTVPNIQKDDLALRRAQSRPPPLQRDGPKSFASVPMSQADMEKWERLKMTDPSEESPVCQACLEKTGRSKAGKGHGKVVTFGAVTEMEQPVDTSEGEETHALRRLLPTAAVPMPTIGPGSRLSEREHSLSDIPDLNQTPVPSAPEDRLSPAEVDARLAQYMSRTEEEEEEEDEERIPDLEKDDMMARRTRAFHKQSSSTKVYHSRFLPMPGTKHNTPDATEHFPWSKKEADGGKHSRTEQIKSAILQPVEMVKTTSPYEEESQESEESLCKDDMMARRTGASLKSTGSNANRFLPVPGSVKYNSNAPKQSRATSVDKAAVERKERALVRERPESEEKDCVKLALDQEVHSSQTVSSRLYTVSPPAAPRECANAGEERGKVTAQERVQELGSQAPKRPFWLEDDDDELPPIMTSRRVAFIAEDTESASMSDILNEDEVGQLPHITPSRSERMQEQYTSFKEDESEWQDDLARWKNRRRSASQDLIKKEEERKMIEKKMKDESDKRKSIKTYKEIIEEKERREVELCEAYKNAATPEEAALVLQRYALRFTISDATLDSLKVPRAVVSAPNVEPELKPSSTAKDSVAAEQHQTIIKTDYAQPENAPENSLDISSMPTPPLSPVKTPEHVPPVSSEQPAIKPRLLQSQVNVSSGPLTVQHPPIHPLLPSPPSRPVPLLTAKPWSAQSGHKSFKMDGLVRVNGDASEASSAHTPPLSPLNSPMGSKGTPTSPASPMRSPVGGKDTLTSPASPIRSPVGGRGPPTSPASPIRSPMVEKCTPTSPASPMRSSVGGKGTPTSPASPMRPPVVDKGTPISPASPASPMRSPVGGKGTPASPASILKPSKEPPPREPTAETLAPFKPSQPPPPPHTERPTSATSSAISSLIGGRNCVITTTIVTELTHVESVTPEQRTNGQVNGTSAVPQETVDEQRSPVLPSPINSVSDFYPSTTDGMEDGSVSTETPMLNLAKRVNHWVWDPNEERKRLERWQQEQERLLQEQYEKEQEKLKQEWERAQLEVEEEERKHNEEERRILEETVSPLNPTAVLSPPPPQTRAVSPTEAARAKSGSVPPQHNGHKASLGSEGQHASKLHFFQDTTCDVEASRKQELVKTESLDYCPQPKQPLNVKRSGSHDTAVGRQQSHPPAHPPSPSRCVSGKRLCSGCSQPLGKGAAMIIDTLGLFFHMQCFKCGVCDGQLGNTTAGTDVRIRNGSLSCHECYIASRGRGQPTTL